jgi:dTDP-4-amino-4,6-dideoxygalactose transaminase
VFEQLSAAGIGVQVHYIPVHLQPYYRRTHKARPGDFPEAEAHYQEALSLPIFYGLGNDDVGEVVRALRAALGATDGAR